LSPPGIDLPGGAKGKYTLLGIEAAGGAAFAERFTFNPTALDVHIKSNFDEEYTHPLGSTFEFNNLPKDFDGDVVLTTDYLITGDLIDEQGLVGKLTFKYSVGSISIGYGPVSAKFGPLF